jgi:hypothetical protein
VQRRLQDRDTVVLQHVEERRLASIIEAEEKQFGVLVQQAELRQDVIDCDWSRTKSASQSGSIASFAFPPFRCGR